MHPDPIRRHADGSIDYGFYHRRAARLRSQATHRTLKGISMRKLITITAAIAALAAVAISASTPASARGLWSPNGATWNGSV